MKWFDNTALTLVIIGALNWLLVGIFKLDIVAVIFGNLTWLSRIIYTRELANGNFSCILWYEKCLRHILMHQLFSGIASTIAVISL